MDIKSVPPDVAPRLRQRLMQRRLSSSEDAYEKHVLGDYVIGDKVGEKAVEQYHHAGKSRELFADKSETDIHGDYVQSYVYDAERKHYACKLFHCTLYEYGHSCHSAWVKTACVYKGLCV